MFQIIELCSSAALKKRTTAERLSSASLTISFCSWSLLWVRFWCSLAQLSRLANFEVPSCRANNGGTKLQRSEGMRTCCKQRPQMIFMRSSYPHEQLSAGQVVVVIGENIRQFLKRLHAVSAEEDSHY